MARNELVLIDNAIKADQESRPVPLPGDVAFELFACEQLLRDYELGGDEIEAGRVGGGMDGAIDGIYVFLGDSLLSDDSEILAEDFVAATVPRGVQLTLWVIQAKRDDSFGETAIDLVDSSLERLLDLGADETKLLLLYSPDVVRRMQIFTTSWQRIASRKPRLRIRFAYATRGDTTQINDRVRAKAHDLERKLATLVSSAECQAIFVGATELWELKNQSPTYTLELPFEENATKGTSHVAIVSIADYFSFITDGGGNLQRHIFDWNVRDFQGNVEVNREIRESLESESAPEFWWMNNGITIISSAATIVGKTYILHDVQIVNGLQTSHTIYEYMSTLRGSEGKAANRSLLIRILVTGDIAARDKVIRATNRQTSVPDASLRATDEIQRKIEAYFLDKEWYYDRRKNFYKNNGRNAARIVSISFLAQSVMAMGLSRPDSSRARPSSLLKRDEEYKRVFSTEVPLETYLWLAKTQRISDSFLAGNNVGATTAERTNFRFHVSMLAVVRLFGGMVFSPKQLRVLTEKDVSVSEDDIKRAFDSIISYAKDFNSERGWTQDRLVKNREFVTYILDTDTAS